MHGRSVGASWRGAPVGARMAQVPDLAGSAPIAGIWIWKRLYARVDVRFHCRVWKAVCAARAAATGAWW